MPDADDRSTAEDEAITFSAGPHTDWFCDPRTGRAVKNAPVRTVATGSTPLMVSCHARATLEATFDAAALFVHYDDDHWVKLAVERSPSGRPTVVSVRTAVSSDDVNHVALPGPGSWLRVAVDERSVALHVSADGSTWDLVRYAAAPLLAAPSVGLLVQSPMGTGATGTFTSLRIEQRALEELRDGS